MIDNNQHIIICVGRQLGSGGHAVAQLLANDFQAKLYDSELLNLAARESGFSEKVFEQNDERKGFFRTLLNIQSPSFGGGLYRSNLSQESLFQFQSDAIRKAAQEGNCVFVGRCADYVLRDMPQVVSIFISASMRFRIDQVRAHERHCHLTPRETKRFILQEEERRARYYNYFTGRRWGAAETYDLCVDASILGIEETARFVASFIRQRYQL